MPKEPSPYKTSPDTRRDRAPAYDTLRRRSREPERPSSANRHHTNGASSSYSSRNSSGDSIKANGRSHNGHLNGRRHAEDDAITMASRRGGPKDDAMAVCEPSVSRGEEKKRRETYTKHLILKKRGFPLLSPQPDLALGDVGTLTPSGGFDILFNILLPADHAKNRSRVPADFVPFTPTGTRSVEYRSNAFISSAEIKRTTDESGASVFETGKATDGAILATPGGVECEDLDQDEDVPALRTYVAEHLEGWYRSAQVRNGDLRVVIGLDRANSPWGVAVFPSVPQGSRFKFHSTGKGSSSSLSAQEVYTWQRSTAGHFREGASSTGVFLRTLNPKLREGAKPITPPEVPHPSDDLNTRLLKWSASAKVVISEDHNWCSILSSKEPIFPSAEKLWGRFSESFQPVITDNGLLYPEPLPPPPQSTGSTYTPANDDSTLERLPVERPRRGKCPPKHFADVHDRNHMEARKFKHSGFARYAALLPPLHRDYRPLTGSLPEPNTPYAVHQALFGRLEMLEAVLGFVYATWNKEQSSPKGLSDMDWVQMRNIIEWCRVKWDGSVYGDAERAFQGLMHMLDTFIQAKLMFRFVEKKLSVPTSLLHADLCKTIKAAIPSDSSDSSQLLPAVSPAAAATPIADAPTPTNADTPRPHGIPGLPPKPSFITSNHSTPTKSNLTPSRTAQAQSLEVPKSRLNSSVSPSPSTSTPRSLSDDPSRSPCKPGTAQPPPYKEALHRLQDPHDTPASDALIEAMNTILHPVSGSILGNVLTLSTKCKQVNTSSHLAREMLTLPIVFRCFPRTWRRVVYTTLGPRDEHEPDFDSDEGGLYWPDHSLNGQSIGWVCLLGKAMVKEFGAPFGYKGIDGVLLKSAGR